MTVSDSCDLSIRQLGIFKEGIPKVGIQGIAASFHDEAVRKFFSSFPVISVPTASFPLLCKNLREKKTDLALMAIENSIAGSILPNYSLLESNSFQILGEVYLRIKMNLMALPGQTLQDIQWVKSHPMALLQCEDFLLTCPWMKVIEGSDTAASAKEIEESKLKGYAAIASRLAAETYHLELMKSGIESNTKNYTRFLVLCRGEDYISPPLDSKDLKKASFRFEVPDQPGSLVNVLEVLNHHSINMTHLQSVVIPGRPYEYSFHMDLEWNNRDAYEAAIRQIRNKSLRLIHFGIYLRGELPPENSPTAIKPDHPLSAERDPSHV